MANAKPWYASKQIWISIGIVAAGTLQLIMQQNLVSGSMLISIGYLMTILRLITTQAIQVNGTNTTPTTPIPIETPT